MEMEDDSWPDKAATSPPGADEREVTLHQTPSKENDKEREKEATQPKKVHPHAFWKLQSTKRRYCIRTEGIMRRQQALLANLQSENSALQEIVDTYVIKDYEQQMAHLMQEASKYTSLIEMEKEKIDKLDVALDELSRKELGARRAMGNYKAGWINHFTNQIQIQQAENRLQKVTVQLNVVKDHNKSIKEKMKQMKQDREFYGGINKKLDKEMKVKKNDIEKCFESIKKIYGERNEFQEDMSDLHEMDENQHNYYQWLTTKGWSTQEPIPLLQLGVEYFCEVDLDEFGTGKEEHIQGMEGVLNPSRTLKKSQLIKRGMAGDYYRKWVEIKAFSYIQDLLDINTIPAIMPALLEARNKNVELLSDVIYLIKEMDELDATARDSILSLPTTDYTQIRSSLGSWKQDVDETVESLLEMANENEVGDEVFVSLVTDLKKQIAVTFKEAGCDVSSEEKSIEIHKSGVNLKENVALEIVINKLFSKIKNFVTSLEHKSGK